MKINFITLIGYISAFVLMSLSTIAYASYAEDIHKICKSENSYEYQVCIKNELKK